MNKTRDSFKMIAYLFIMTIILFGCASTTIIQSVPGDASLFLNGESVGSTPYTLKDKKIVGSRTTVKIVKDGYETFNTIIVRNEEVDIGAIIGGIFVDVPFLWLMKYKPLHTYELTPAQSNQTQINESKQSPQQNSEAIKAARLKEIKALLEDRIITQEQYDNAVKKILEEIE